MIILSDAIALRAEASAYRKLADICDARAAALEQEEPAPAATPVEIEPTWRERLWTASAETRIGKDELLEATGKSRSWLYRLTGRKEIPHRIDDSGELVFVVGEIRSWLRAREVVIVPGELAREDIRRRVTLSGAGR